MMEHMVQLICSRGISEANCHLALHFFPLLWMHVVHSCPAGRISPEFLILKGDSSRKIILTGLKIRSWNSGVGWGRGGGGVLAMECALQDSDLEFVPLSRPGFPRTQLRTRTGRLPGQLWQPQ